MTQFQIDPTDPDSTNRSTPQNAAPLTSPYPHQITIATTTSSSQAKWGFALSLVGLCTSCLLIGIPIAIAGLIVSILAMVNIKKTVEPVRGSGLATAGIAIGAATIVLIPIIALLIGIMLPALGAARRTARQMQNSTQLRGISQACILFSQGNSGYYPGISVASGTPVVTHATSQERVEILIQANYIPRQFAINPASDGSETVTSYALLGIGMGKNVENRATEWRDTTNSQAIISSDRMIANGSGLKSWWANPGFNQSDWRGSVVWNDNHSTFETSNVIAGTQYGKGTLNTRDDLFQSQPGAMDALMVYTDGQTP